MNNDYEFEQAISELEDMNLDFDNYTYYYHCILDLYHDDKISVKNGRVGYESLGDILEDAYNCVM